MYFIQAFISLNKIVYLYFAIFYDIIDIKNLSNLFQNKFSHHIIQRRMFQSPSERHNHIDDKYKYINHSKFQRLSSAYVYIWAAGVGVETGVLRTAIWYKKSSHLRYMRK
jgi:hypothetical protein